MGVAAEVAQDMFGAAEGRRGVDVPFLAAELLDQLLEPSRITEVGCWTAAIELILAVELPQSIEEPGSERRAQYRNRQQEHWMAGMNPALVIGRQSAAGNDCVDMVMGQQVRSPCVQDGEEPDLCAEALGIGRRFEPGLRTGIPEQFQQRLA